MSVFHRACGGRRWRVRARLCAKRSLQNWWDESCLDGSKKKRFILARRVVGKWGRVKASNDPPWWGSQGSTVDAHAATQFPKLRSFHDACHHSLSRSRVLVFSLSGVFASPVKHTKLTKLWLSLEIYFSTSTIPSLASSSPHIKLLWQAKFDQSR